MAGARILSPTLPGKPTESAVIERYFEVSLYLLLVTGFVTLAGTGRLDVASVVFVTGALGARGWQLLQRREARIPESWTNYITIVYIAFYIADFLFLSGSFVTATVHLVLFSMVVKIFSVQRDRDHMYLAVLAFLEVLAAAVLTVESTFLGAFGIFLLLAITTFASMEMKRSAARATQRTNQLPVRPADRHASRFGNALSLTATTLLAGIALIAPLMFFLLPRVSAGYLGAFAPRNEIVSGFGNDINLGEIGTIQQSSTVVMHVTFTGTHPAPEAIKWRGSVLDEFTGKRWKATLSGFPLMRHADGGIDLRGAMLSSGYQAKGWEPINYRVLMEPIGLNVFFLPSVAQEVRGNYRFVQVDDGGAVFNADRDHFLTTYNGLSNVAIPPLTELRQATAEPPPGITNRYLKTPRLDRRIVALAEQVTAKAVSPYEKAAALELYLRTNFGYTLQLPQTPVDDPLANFLFERKQGHCEYFASAMAVMLRTLGIPSRIVNGFRTGEYNDVTGSYIIRARDAHSWVEAYFAGAGWVAFDPTPASGAVTFKSGWARVLLYVDAMREFWREWVINYDFAHQRTLTTGAATSTRQWVDARRRWWQEQYRKLLFAADNVRDQAAREPGKWAWRSVSVATIALLLINLRRLYRVWQRRRLLRAPESAPVEAAGLWYQRMTRRLARHGWRKRATQAPREFAAGIDDAELRGRVTAFTDAYERARFGASAEAAKELPERYEEVAGKR